MKLPLEKRLRKRLHVEVAFLQDAVVEAVYECSENAVLHGGTAVWRCFGGNRFSEDLDFYCSDISKIDECLPRLLERRGLQLRKYKKTANLVFCKVASEGVEVRLEINFARTTPREARSFEKTDGTSIQVFCLPARELFLEKISAYENRRFARDLYDLIQLKAVVENDAQVKARLEKFLAAPPPPVDEATLKATVLAGTIPSFKQMTEQLKAFLK
ncbi:MAG: nucleotidyl transferase AbiEii/AbiGii toxin family protein [Candidatus Micrarchaeota archaeon]